MTQLEPDLSAPLVTRFAPAPTGYLHLGHLVNAIHVWGIARARGGRVVLRIEDHDRGRSRPEYERALREDLAWVGLEADAGSSSGSGGAASSFRQSDNGERYEAAVAQLVAAGGRLYGCDCSRRTMAAQGGDQPDQETRYDGHCRERRLQPGLGVGLRLVLDEREESFTDLLRGPQRQVPSRQCGDLLLRDKAGNWTYQFAVVVDDIAQQISHVIRGEDLLGSTGRQIGLARMLGRVEPPAFAHHRLIRHPSGEKLSKANRDTSLRELRASGHSAENLLGRAATMSGLIEQERPVGVVELEKLFSHRMPFETPSIPA